MNRKCVVASIQYCPVVLLPYGRLFSGAPWLFGWRLFAVILQSASKIFGQFGIRSLVLIGSFFLRVVSIHGILKAYVVENKILGGAWVFAFVANSC